jgi:DNA-binding NtrC family response regulator
LLTDLAMPDSDGMDAINAMRKEQPDLRVVVMTGAYTSTPGVIRAAIHLGAAAVLPKPFYPGQLLKALLECSEADEATCTPSSRRCGAVECRASRRALVRRVIGS